MDKGTKTSELESSLTGAQVEHDTATLRAPQQIYSIDQSWECLSWINAHPLSLLFTICTKSISALRRSMTAKTSSAGWGGVRMWISSSLVSAVVKAVTKRDEKKEKEEVETVGEREGRALIPALRGSGIQMTCACGAD